jgi:glutathione peroxidase-family protein
MNYGVTFPMMSKIDANGDQADPLFMAVRRKRRARLAPRPSMELHRSDLSTARSIERYAPMDVFRKASPTTSRKQVAAA